jgi:protein-disulfide isomerase
LPIPVFRPARPGRRTCVPALATLLILLPAGCADGPERIPAIPAGFTASADFADFADSGPFAALRLPRFFGRADAPQTLILYTNPQCPPCRRTWPAFAELFRTLDPKRTQIIITGEGFTDGGTRLMFAAAVLAERSPALAVEFLSAVMLAGPEASRDRTWVNAWLARQGADVDPESLGARFTSLDAAANYLAGLEDVRRRYGLEFTPSIVLNGGIYHGPHTPAAIREALER